jgi:uncharacterized protein (TIGR00299 family) protein
VLVHLDPVGGIAGDMFLAACIDAWPEMAQGVEEAMRAAGLPSTWRLGVEPGRSHGLAGTRVGLRGPDPDEDHLHHGDHTGAWREIRARLRECELAEPVRARALDIFERLAVAEASVHGVEVDDVHFHELADWDSIADIVGAAWCIDSIGASAWSIAPLPLGSGSITTSHGPLPVPAPAVTRLLRGHEVFDDGVGGERVTPTGAALVAHLEPSPDPLPRGTLAAAGNGLGTRDLPDRANLLRLIAIEPAAHGRAGTGTPWMLGAVTTVTFEIDDQAPEDLAVALERLRATDGVIDVTESPTVGKKGRLGSSIRVLCRPERRTEVVSACFAQTTTIGLRWHEEHRAELSREQVTGADVAGKAVVRPDGSVTSKPEMDSIAAVADDLAERERARSRFRAATDT